MIVAAISPSPTHGCRPGSSPSTSWPGPDRSSPLRRRDGMAIPAAGGPTSHECDAHLRLVLPNHGRDVAVSARLRADIAEGFRWVWHHAAIRTLVLTIFTFNITFGAAWSVLVLYTARRLGLGEIGFGLITTVSAVGGVLELWAMAG